MKAKLSLAQATFNKTTMVFIDAPAQGQKQTKPVAAAIASITTPGMRF
jgi:hypothetical protein